VLWARDQGKFWEMHDALFANQANLSPAALPGIADKVGLSGAKLTEMLKGDAYKQELESFKAQGNAANITGTPSIFFNGRRFQLPPEPDVLSQSLDDELEWRANNNAWAAD
jgi:protein-disulfide isomerase